MNTSQTINLQHLYDTQFASQYLLGCLIIREINGQKIVGKIVETELYHQNDPAAHSFRGKTPRTEIMFGPAGYAYVYFSYGVHWCMNVVVGKEGQGAAVLIRALEPIAGIEQMKAHRGTTILQNLASGPGKLTQALAIDKQFYGHDLSKPPLQITEGERPSPHDIITTTRIGISKAQEAPLRFYIRNNPHVSRK